MNERCPRGRGLPSGRAERNPGVTVVAVLVINEATAMLPIRVATARLAAARVLPRRGLGRKLSTAFSDDEGPISYMSDTHDMLRCGASPPPPPGPRAARS